jgi:hypothetical protein
VRSCLCERALAVAQKRSRTSTRAKVILIFSLALSYCCALAQPQERAKVILSFFYSYLRNKIRKEKNKKRKKIRKDKNQKRKKIRKDTNKHRHK